MAGVQRRRSSRHPSREVGQEEPHVETVPQGDVLSPNALPLPPVPDMFPHVLMSGHLIGLVVYFNMFVFALVSKMQQDVLPLKAKSLNMDIALFRKFQQHMAVGEFFIAPFFGSLIDTRGPRATMLLVLLSTLLTHALITFAVDGFFLYVSQIPAMLMQTLLVCQVSVVRLSSFRRRTEALGLLGCAYGLGSFLGSVVSSSISSEYHVYGPAFITIPLMTFTLGMTVILFDGPDTHSLYLNNGENIRQHEFLSFQRIFFQFKNGKFVFLLSVKILSWLPYKVFFSSLEDPGYLGLSVKSNDRYLLPVLTWIIPLLTQSYGILAATRMVSDKVLFQLCTALVSVTYVVLCAVHPSLSHFFVISVILLFGMCMTNLLITSTMTKSVNGDCVGTVLGINLAIHSSMRAFMPLLCNYLYVVAGYTNVLLVGSMFHLVIVVLGYHLAKTWYRAA